MLTPVLPDYVEKSLGHGSIAVGIAVGAFAVGAVLLRPFAGRIGDSVGRRVLIVGGALIVAATTACYGLVHALWFLVLLRVASGFGEAGFFVGAATMITDLAPGAPARRSSELLVDRGVRRALVRARARIGVARPRSLRRRVDRRRRRSRSPPRSSGCSRWRSNARRRSQVPGICCTAPRSVREPCCSSG